MSELCPFPFNKIDQIEATRLNYCVCKARKRERHSCNFFCSKQKVKCGGVLWTFYKSNHVKDTFNLVCLHQQKSGRWWDLRVDCQNSLEMSLIVLCWGTICERRHMAQIVKGHRLPDKAPHTGIFQVYWKCQKKTEKLNSVQNFKNGNILSWMR